MVVVELLTHDLAQVQGFESSHWFLERENDHYMWASCNSTVVEQITHDPKFKGLNPVTGTLREKSALICWLLAVAQC